MLDSEKGAAGKRGSVVESVMDPNPEGEMVILTRLWLEFVIRMLVMWKVVMSIS